MTGKYKIDGLDMFDTYGVVVSDGSDDFLAFPNSKEVYFHDFKDENGKQYWLGQRFFEDKTAILSITLLADTEESFKTKRDALWARLSASGERTIYINELDMSFQCFYKSTKSTERLTRIKVGQVAVKMQLEFQVIDILEGGEVPGSGGEVTIKDQDGETVAVVQAPGEYEVLVFSGIQDDGSMNYQNSIVDPL